MGQIEMNLQINSIVRLAKCHDESLMPVPTYNILQQSAYNGTQQTKNGPQLEMAVDMILWKDYDFRRILC